MDCCHLRRCDLMHICLDNKATCDHHSNGKRLEWCCFYKVRFIQVRNWSSVRLSCLTVNTSVDAVRVPHSFPSKGHCCAKVLRISGLKKDSRQQGGCVWQSAAGCSVGRWGTGTSVAASVFLFRTTTSSIFNWQVSDLISIHC